MAEQEIGVITHWFGHLSVAALQVTKGSLKVGDKIHIKGHTTDLTATVETLQVNHKDVKEARAGDSVGIRLSDHVREHDKVYVVQ